MPMAWGWLDWGGCEGGGGVRGRAEARGVDTPGLAPGYVTHTRAEEFGLWGGGSGRQ